jgi:hypothetical protein
VTRYDENRLGLSATTFLLLYLWMGPTAACWLIAIVAIVAAWIALCRRFPAVGYFTYVFFDGFVGGLFGSRGGGYGYGYYYAPRRRRR